MNDNRNEQRTLLAIVLSLMVFTLWTWVYGPQPGAPPPEDAAAAPSVPVAEAPVVPTPAVVAGPCTSAPEVVANDVLALKLDNCGRFVTGIKLERVQAPVVVTPWWSWLWAVVTGDAPGTWEPVREVEGPLELLADGSTYGVPRFGEGDTGGTWQVTRQDGAALFRRVREDGVLLSVALAPTDSVDLFDVTYRWEADRAVRGPVWVEVEAPAFQPVHGAYDTGPRLVARVNSGFFSNAWSPVTSVLDPTVPYQEHQGEVGWFGVEDRYYMAVLQPIDPDGGTIAWGTPPGGAPRLVFTARQDLLEPGNPVEAKFRLYVGAKAAGRLAEIDDELEYAANLGWFALFGKALLFLLDVLHAGLKNWGLSIMGVTVVVRALLWPVMRNAFLSGRKMQFLAPKLKELQEKYAENREELGRATFALYAEHKVSPFSGCLPAFIQIPVFLALFNGLRTSPDLFHADFLYIYDLSMPDPYGILPTVMTLGMWLQQRMTPMTGLDPQQQTIMKLMPFMFAAFMYTMPAGLQVYYVVNTALSLFQQWVNVTSWEREQAKGLATA